MPGQYALIVQIRGWLGRVLASPYGRKSSDCYSQTCCQEFPLPKLFMRFFEELSTISVEAEANDKGEDRQRRQNFLLQEDND